MSEHTCSSSNIWGAGIQAVCELTGSYEVLHGACPLYIMQPQTNLWGFAFNNVAIAAKYLVNAGQRVLIVDYDAHHGNGTMEIFMKIQMFFLFFMSGLYLLGK